MKSLHQTNQTPLILARHAGLLYTGVALLLLAVPVQSANAAEPFQLLASDLEPEHSAIAAQDNVPAPAFKMLASDLKTARVTIYQGSETAGDSQITNHAGDGVLFKDQSSADAASIINNSGGMTDFADQTTAANALITNNADAVLHFQQLSTAADARITNNNGGHMVFHDQSAAGSAVITNNGTLAFHDQTSADNALITINASGLIVFNDQSGAGKRNIYNNGQIGFNQQSSAENSLIDNNQTGAIVFSNQSTAGNAMINNSGALVMRDASSGADMVAVNNASGTIAWQDSADAGDATITNSGHVSFDGTSSAGHANLINNAQAMLQFDGSSSAGNAMITNAGTLQFSGASTAAQATILAGAGSQVQFSQQAQGGSASLHLDQDAQLDVSQMAQHQLSLGGLTSAGRIDLGKTSLTVADKAVLNQSSKLSLVLGYGQLVAKEVELQGGSLELQRAVDLLYRLGETYQIIAGQSFSGTNFNEVIAHDFAFATPNITADGSAIILERNDVAFNTAAQSANQSAVANALEQLEPERAVYRAIISADKAQASASFDQLSGEIHASVTGFLHQNSDLLRNALLQRSQQATAQRLPGQPAWQSWLNATGGVMQNSTSSGIAASSASGYGVSGGMDYAVTDQLIAGFAGHYQHNDFKLSSRASSADITSWGGGLYAGWQQHSESATPDQLVTVPQGFGLRGGASYQHHNIASKRTLDLPALNGTIQSDYTGWTAQAFAEAGYQFNLGNLAVEPFTGVSYVYSKFDNFAETGLADAALNGDASSLDSRIARLGIRMNQRFVLGSGMMVDAKFEAAWNRAFGGTAVNRQLAFSSGLPFDINGTALSKDYLSLDAKLSFLRSERLDVSVIYSGLLGAQLKNHHFGTSASLRF